MKWVKITWKYLIDAYKRKDYSLAITATLLFPLFVILTWYDEKDL
jgi:hypothetical protein